MKIQVRAMVIAFLVLFPINLLAQPYQGEKGDVNNDGTVNIMDAIKTVNHILVKWSWLNKYHRI